MSQPAPQQPRQPVRPTNAKAVLAVALLWCAPASIVFGVLARREIRRTGEAGWGLATWGMALGIAGASLYAAYLVFFALYLAAIAVFGLAAAAGAGGGAGWTIAP